MARDKRATTSSKTTYTEARDSDDGEQDDELVASTSKAKGKGRAKKQADDDFDEGAFSLMSPPAADPARARSALTCSVPPRR